MTESNPSDVISPKSPGSGCRRRKTRVLFRFDLLQGCNAQEVALSSQEMTSRDLSDRKLPGSRDILPEVTWRWL